ncbi:unnamed protein product [Cyprideis torosa]|uniref:Uncharacterized protein n=1 Tax=Cyprideis torosa TaxID=163714 RepID=A0A7R8W9R7_9CRUS|nr:unnamed protein product [Cyprideis torosa]CAG0890113.1 unnamed protein product [Cyprideis torosa]
MFALLTLPGPVPVDRGKAGETYRGAAQLAPPSLPPASSETNVKAFAGVSRNGLLAKADGLESLGHLLQESVAVGQAAAQLLQGIEVLHQQITPHELLQVAALLKGACRRETGDSLAATPHLRFYETAIGGVQTSDEPMLTYKQNAGGSLGTNARYCLRKRQTRQPSTSVEASACLKQGVAAQRPTSTTFDAGLEPPRANEEEIDLHTKNNTRRLVALVCFVYEGKGSKGYEFVVPDLMRPFHLQLLYLLAVTIMMIQASD